MKELFTRIAVAIVGIPLLLFLIWQGSWYFFALIAIISLAGQLEFYNLVKEKDAYPQIFTGVIMTMLLLLMVQSGYNKKLLALFILMITILFAYEMFRNKVSAILNTSVTLSGVVYPGFFLAPLLFLRENIQNLGISSPYGFIVTLFIAIWICDTAAYFVGKSVGKNPLFKRVSPKKSVEGALGGLIGAILVFIVVYYGQFYTISLKLALSSGIIVGTFGQLGDLVESWFKRDAGIKDSSSLIPGHGGFLDKMDGFLPVT